ncbi:MAG: hypothetical protein ABW108_03835, partial [Candidatus Thiodiazotropha sp. 6PLUC10]
NNAYGIMINAASGTAFVEEGVHIDRYTSVAQHYLPDDPVHYRLPSLASGNIQEAYITNVLGDGMKGDTLPLTEYDTGALHNISPSLSVPMGSNPLPIAMLLSASAISAPYFVDERVNGMTDIVLTFPMRKHGIYKGRSLTNQMISGEPACVGTLDDGVDDGREVTLLGVLVQDYPHDGMGRLCTSAGFDITVAENNVSNIISTIEYYDYNSSARTMWDFRIPYGIVPIDAEWYDFERSVNVKGIIHRYSHPFLGAGNVSNQGTAFIVDDGYPAGWLTVTFFDRYNYETNPDISLLTESIGGLGSGVNQSWIGIPVIGFSAMASDVQSNQVGEVVELIRSVER